ncbi:hypothetical protein RMSM_01850 [Rhodopirellula maiorica SM1]|uniref:Uncharacterized protein n=1 Tax=Rhodopirellula maiorica SM1 TaxID=1265738 RepID=M5S4V5_9BACT|nr:hypothetical protein RMSM_01850 [Rhodopirellula maiorica SM1]
MHFVDQSLASNDAIPNWYEPLAIGPVCGIPTRWKASPDRWKARKWTSIDQPNGCESLTFPQCQTRPVQITASGHSNPVGAGIASCVSQSKFPSKKIRDC